MNLAATLWAMLAGILCLACIDTILAGESFWWTLAAAVGAGLSLVNAHLSGDA